MQAFSYNTREKSAILRPSIVRAFPLVRQQNQSCLPLGLDLYMQRLQNTEAPCPFETVEPNLKPLESVPLANVITRRSYLHYAKAYYELWKTKLSIMVTMSAVVGYASAATENSTFDIGTLGWVTLGTFLQSASANSINQVMEVKQDGIMTRTRTRPLPSNRLSRTHAVVQAAVVGALGTGLLYWKCNPTTALLGVLNHFIYTSLYTPSKQMHSVNTWIGAITGAIPPVMGCAAANATLSPAAFHWGWTLLWWQIPHFMALSFKCGKDYAKAGFKMLPNSNPRLAAIWSLVFSLLLLPTPWVRWYFQQQAAGGFNVSSIASLLVNMNTVSAALYTLITARLLVKPSVTFLRERNYDNATRLFLSSLAYLTAVIGVEFLSTSLYRVGASFCSWIASLFS